MLKYDQRYSANIVQTVVHCSPSTEAEGIHRYSSLPAYTQTDDDAPVVVKGSTSDEPVSCPDNAIFVGSPSPEPDTGA